MVNTTNLTLFKGGDLFLQADVLFLQFSVVLQQTRLSDLVLSNVITQTTALQLHNLIILKNGTNIYEKKNQLIFMHI